MQCKANYQVNGARYSGASGDRGLAPSAQIGLQLSVISETLGGSSFPLQDSLLPSPKAAPSTADSLLREERFPFYPNFHTLFYHLAASPANHTPLPHPQCRSATTFTTAPNDHHPSVRTSQRVSTQHMTRTAFDLSPACHPHAIDLHAHINPSIPLRDRPLPSLPCPFLPPDLLARSHHLTPFPVVTNRQRICDPAKQRKSRISALHQQYQSQCAQHSLPPLPSRPPFSRCRMRSVASSPTPRSTSSMSQTSRP